MACMEIKTVCHGRLSRSVSFSQKSRKQLLVANQSVLPLVGDEITIIGSFSETYKFPATIDYLDSGKVKVKGIVNKTFKLEQWKECIEAMKNKSAIVSCGHVAIQGHPLPTIYIVPIPDR
jgi:threonine dehydrogenase-like Zn-dependent dehydrogenase